MKLLTKLIKYVIAILFSITICVFLLIVTNRRTSINEILDEHNISISDMDEYSLHSYVYDFETSIDKAMKTKDKATVIDEFNNIYNVEISLKPRATKRKKEISNFDYENFFSLCIFKFRKNNTYVSITIYAEGIGSIYIYKQEHKSEYEFIVEEQGFENFVKKLVHK